MQAGSSLPAAPGRMPRMARVTGSEDTFFVADRVVDIETALNAAWPPLPREMGLKVHWLAVDGRQPATIDNPSPDELHVLARARGAAGRPTDDVSGLEATDGDQAGSKAAAAGDKRKRSQMARPGAGAGAPVSLMDVDASLEVDLVPPAAHALSKEAQRLLAKTCGVLRQMKGRDRAAADEGYGALADHTESDGGANGVAGNGAAEESAAAAARRALLLDAVCTTLSREPAAEPLVPFLSQFIVAEINGSLDDATYLRTAIVRAVAALVHRRLGRSAALESCLHQLLPALLTCVVNKKLTGVDSWALRRFAGDLVARICAAFSSAYPDLAPRTLRTLVAALGKPSLATRYGALETLCAFGHHALALVLPEAESCLGAARATLATGRDVEQALMASAAAQKAVGAFVRHHCANVDSPTPVDASAIIKAVDAWGEAIVPYFVEPLPARPAPSAAAAAASRPPSQPLSMYSFV